MKIFILGQYGMVAHTMIMYLSEQGHDVKAVSLRDVNLEDYEWPMGYDLVINCVGILVKESEENKDMAILYNSYLPHLLEKRYEDTKTKVIHISTDCIVDKDFYGRTKALGEIENTKDLTLRMSVIGTDLSKDGTGLFNWFMQQKKSIDGYEYAMWNGITTLQLAKSIEKTIGMTGIYNLVPPYGMSKYNLLRVLNEVFERKLIINPVEQGKDKMLPPGDKIALPSYETMFNEMKEWIDEHPALYAHYR